MSMSKADEFRQSTKDFWLKMDDQKGKVAQATPPKTPSVRASLSKVHKKTARAKKLTKRSK